MMRLEQGHSLLCEDEHGTLCAAMSSFLYDYDAVSSFHFERVMKGLYGNALKLCELKFRDQESPPVAWVVVDARLVVAWRGSYTSLDWLTNTACTPVANPAWQGLLENHSLTDIKVHSGWSGIVNGDFAQFESTWWDIVERYAIKEICFTGHSLGGALATIAHMTFMSRLYEREVDVRLNSIVFAAPMAFYFKSPVPEHIYAIQRDFGATCVNFVYSADLFPRLPRQISLVNTVMTMSTVKKTLVWGAVSAVGQAVAMMPASWMSLLLPLPPPVAVAWNTSGMVIGVVRNGANLINAVRLGAQVVWAVGGAGMAFNAVGGVPGFAASIALNALDEQLVADYQHMATLHVVSPTQSSFKWLRQAYSGILQLREDMTKCQMSCVPPVDPLRQIKYEVVKKDFAELEAGDYGFPPYFELDLNETNILDYVGTCHTMLPSILAPTLTIDHLLGDDVSRRAAKQNRIFTRANCPYNAVISHYNVWKQFVESTQRISQPGMDLLGNTESKVDFGWQPPGVQQTSFLKVNLSEAEEKSRTFCMTKTLDESCPLDSVKIQLTSRDEGRKAQWKYGDNWLGVVADTNPIRWSHEMTEGELMADLEAHAVRDSHRPILIAFKTQKRAPDNDPDYHEGTPVILCRTLEEVRNSFCFSMKVVMYSMSGNEMQENVIVDANRQRPMAEVVVPAKEVAGATLSLHFTSGMKDGNVCRRSEYGVQCVLDGTESMQPGLKYEFSCV